MTITEPTCADLLDEYACALRGSWGEIDGRDEQCSLMELADAFRTFGNDPLSQSEVEKQRENLGVCPYGQRHWTDFCDDDCAGTAS